MDFAVVFKLNRLISAILFVQQIQMDQNCMIETQAFQAPNSPTYSSHSSYEAL